MDLDHTPGFVSRIRVSESEPDFFPQIMLRTDLKLTGLFSPDRILSPLLFAENFHPLSKPD